MSQTLRGRYASRLMRKFVEEKYLQRGGKHGGDTGKVCIVGAGAAGVYMAWMLTWLGIDYDLFEANDRIGGRVFTYNKFKADSTDTHSYYDVGAMRIPSTLASMKPTVDALKWLNVPTAPYYITNDSAPNFLGGTYMTNTDVSNALGPWSAAIETMSNALESGFDNEFQTLVNGTNGYDQFSTREFLRTQLTTLNPPQQNMNFAEIQQMETMDTGTGLFDQAFVESVIDDADFPSDNPGWLRVEGGMYQLINAMSQQLNKPASLQTEVTALQMNGTQVDVSYIDRSSSPPTPGSGTYDAVFSSTTLGALQRIDLNGLGSQSQLTAIRSLSYDQASKVAIKFKTAWWVAPNFGPMDGKGGISGTDLPIRIVAYPPWTNKDDPFPSDPSTPTVLIAAYDWHQDAVRMGSLITNSESPPTVDWSESKAVDLVLRNLVTLFNNDNITLDFLQGQVVDYHAWAWQNDPYCSGAFALFGPGQFSNLYPYLFSPLDGSDNNVYLIGEAASAHHAWISGALFSAATSLYGWFLGRVDLYSYALKLKTSTSLGGPPFAGAIDTGDEAKPPGVPDEMEEDVVYWMAQLARHKPEDERLTAPAK